MARFMDDLQFSKLHTADDIALISRAYPGAVIVENTVSGNDMGVDYTVTHNGVTFTIDMKRRRPGVSKYWANRDDPELTLETERSTGNPGFILNPEKVTDVYFFAFDSVDTDKYFIISAKWLRRLFIEHRNEWEQYKHRRYDFDYWSEFYAVPASVIAGCSELKEV